MTLASAVATLLLSVHAVGSPVPDATTNLTKRAAGAKWMITNHYNWDYCLDLVDGKYADGARVQLWDCADGNPNQVWDRVNIQNNRQLVTKTDPSTGWTWCLATTGRYGWKPGANAYITSCPPLNTGGAETDWHYNSYANRDRGYINLWSAVTICLDVPREQFYNGALLETNHCGAGYANKAQLFRYKNL